MEKQRNHTDKRFIKGLLASIFLILNFSLFAATRINSSQIKKLVITPDENTIFTTGKDIKFQLIIPGIPPLDIDVETPSHQDDVVFKTLRVTRHQSSDTKIELWYEFLSQGTTAPLPLNLYIDGKNYAIPFSLIQIDENPMNKKPKIGIQFNNGKSISDNTQNNLFTSVVSQKIPFKVYVQSAKEILSVDYELPKNSLFEQTAEYDLSKISPVTTVGEYSWTPLKKGKTVIPSIRVKVLAYDGSKIELKSPEGYVNITGAKTTNNSSSKDSLFSDSFSEIIQNSDSNESDSSKLISDRVIAKKKHYLKLLFISLAAFILIALVLLIIKIKSPLPYLIISLILIFCMIIFTSLYKKQTAVYTNGIVKSIPEHSGGTVIQFSENSEVKILKELNDWYCIQSGASTGWTLKENIRIY